MFEFGTKAETLERLRPLLEKGAILPALYFETGRWESARDDLAAEVGRAFSGPVIVRSSARGEDAADSSMAGFFLSVAGVDSSDPAAVAAAVDAVAASYAKGGMADPANHVLIQPMLTELSMSGVLFTQDLSTGAPYYVINYDDVSGGHDTVTGGTADTSRTLLVRRGRRASLHSPRFKALLDAVAEIEDVTGSTALDIEFAVTPDETVHVLQVRPLAVEANWNRWVTRRVDRALGQIADFLDSRFRPCPGALGRTSLFGIMPDWNPVEMIGAAPRKLAMSLYRHLITDSVWAEARAAMGYRDMSGRPLMADLAGRGYIDVRESFNSFLPAALPDAVGEKLVDHWLATLTERPELHDKIEFEVAVTVHSFDFDERVRPALAAEAGFAGAEIDEFSRALKALTDAAVGGPGDLVAEQMALVRELERRREAVPPGNGGATGLYCIQTLLADCRTHGTRPFSILARCAFMAEELLRSLVRLGLLTAKRAAAFRGSVRTVLSDFLDDLAAFNAGDMPGEDFQARYGHLRPGTYDILSRRYDQRGRIAGAGGSRTSKEHGGFAPTKDESAAIDAMLAERGYAFDSARLFAFMRAAIAGREDGKFAFTRNLSEALERIAAWGEKNGLSREELSHLSVTDVLDAANVSPVRPLEDHLREVSRANREALDIGQAVRLPYLVASPGDVDVVPLLKCRPNFVTRGTAIAPVQVLTGREERALPLSGRVVFIEGADPGFDWIFAAGIAGLVTKYGGANSHMAIRCAELGIPAAIGCGEQLFARCARADCVVLDCAAEIVKPEQGS